MTGNESNIFLCGVISSGFILTAPHMYARENSLQVLMNANNVPIFCQDQRDDFCFIKMYFSNYHKEMTSLNSSGNFKRRNFS